MERSSAEGILEGRQTIWFRLDHEELGDPEWVAFAIETHQAVTLDRTAWYLFHLTDWPWSEGEDEPSHPTAQAG
jgi:hypothetical protein